MAVVVSIKEVVDALDLPNEEWSAYVDLQTGTVITISGEAADLAEDEDLDEEEIPDWQIAQVEDARRVQDSDRYLRLPDKFDVHEWDLMRRFSEDRRDPRQRNDLIDAIHGSGAFRFFNSTIRRLGIEKEWYRYRDSTLMEIAKNWLQKNGLAYK
jgi:hypothetical protein